LGLAQEWIASALAFALGGALAGRATFLKARMRAIMHRDLLPRVEARVKRVDLVRIDAKPAASYRMHIDCLREQEAIKFDFTIEAADLEAARSSDRYQVLDQAFRAGEAVVLRAWRRLGATEYFADARLYVLDGHNAGRELQTILTALVIGGAMFILVGVAFFFVDL
jgi:hypothetical protein